MGYGPYVRREIPTDACFDMFDLLEPQGCRDHWMTRDRPWTSVPEAKLNSNLATLNFPPSNLSAAAPAIGPGLAMRSVWRNEEDVAHGEDAKL
jgi:hypothetical protein